MDIGQILSWVVGAVGLTGFYFAGKRVWWSWYINLGCQILWFAYALVTGQPAFLVTAAVYFVIFAINACKWTKEHLAVKRMLNDAKKLEPKPESNLILHARRELELIGEEPETIEWYIRVIKEFSDFGHSGASAWFTTNTLERLLRFEPLAYITNRSEDWIHVAEEQWGRPGGIWQNRRDGRLFSNDAGQTYYNVHDKSKKLERSVDWEDWLADVHEKA
jgi:hypothetical protein